MLILSCFTLMACKNAKLSLSSSAKSSESAEDADVPKLADSTGTLQLAESQEDLAQEDAKMEENGFNSSDSSDFLERYCGVEKKAEQTLAVFAREAREEGEEKQKFQKQIESEVNKEIEIQIHFKNLQESRVADVWIKAEIDNVELEYIPGSTIFYTSAFREGKSIDDGIVEKGINMAITVQEEMDLSDFAAKSLQPEEKNMEEILKSVAMFSMEWTIKRIGQVFIQKTQKFKWSIR